MIFRKRCWLCGSGKKVTKHHVIPRSMKPKRNRVIPLCRTCHDIMHKGIERGFNCGRHNEREDLVFKKVKQKDGQVKMIGRLANGKYVFPDFDEKYPIEPNVMYDCLIHQDKKSAYARVIRKIR